MIKPLADGLQTIDMTDFLKSYNYTRTKKPAESKDSAGFHFLAGFQNRERNRAITNLLQMLFPPVLGFTGRW